MTIVMSQPTTSVMTRMIVNGDLDMAIRSTVENQRELIATYAKAITANMEKTTLAGDMAISIVPTLDVQILGTVLVMVMTLHTVYVSVAKTDG